MKKNVLIVGAGGVAHVAAHKCAQHNDVLGDICIASRKREKCDAIIESVRRKKSPKDPSRKLFSKSLDAMDVRATADLIRETGSRIVINLGTSYVNMSVLEACLETGAAYLDTAIHEDPAKPCEDPPWYGNYEWKRRDRCRKKGVTAVLSVGFDPGVGNAYCAHALKHRLDKIENIDIMDVNAGSHGKFFATNFDPEINFREFAGTMWTWLERSWAAKPVHSEKREFDFPVVGRQTLYLNGHEEIHSLARNIDARNIRFWMGFSDHYLNCFSVLKNIGLLSEKPLRTAEGLEVVPLKVVKACLPEPSSLAAGYKGKTCIGCLIQGTRNGEEKDVFIYNICDHEDCYGEVEAQAVSYTAGVPPAAAAVLVAQGAWDAKTMVNVEELDPDPFLELLGKMGLPTEVLEPEPARPTVSPA